MSLSNASEFNSVGGMGMGGFGGWGGSFGLFGLLGLRGIGDLDGRRHGDEDCCESNRNLAVLAAIASAKDTTVAEGRSLAAAICDSEKTNLQQFYAAAIQTANATQSIKDQASAIAAIADKRFDDLAAAGVAQTAAIIAKLNQTELDNLRDQLHTERRRGDARDIEISIQNSNVQAQAQIQAQSHALDRKFDALFSQVAKSNQDIINVGGLMAGVAQSANPVNVKS